MFKSLVEYFTRSGKWSRVRKYYLKDHPRCEACNGTKDLTVHHILPVHLFPENELKIDNLITLCEKMNCHLLLGHLGYFKSYNTNIRYDALMINLKIAGRP